MNAVGARSIALTSLDADLTRWSMTSPSTTDDASSNGSPSPPFLRWLSCTRDE